MHEKVMSLVRKERRLRISKEYLSESTSLSLKWAGWISICAFSEDLHNPNSADDTALHKHLKASVQAFQRKVSTPLYQLDTFGKH